MDNMTSKRLSGLGYLIIDDLIGKNDLELLVDHCDSEPIRKIGTRNLLQNDLIRSVGSKIRQSLILRKLLPKDCIAVQCNYFHKDTINNWYVTLHRDLSIPVTSKIASDQWSGWSKKEGILYAQPPRRVLESLLIVRIHLELNDHKNGALRIVPGSHIPDSLESDEITCNVKKGGALLMRPLILHKSPKLISGTRRVLHFVFGPRTLPDGADWPSESLV